MKISYDDLYRIADTFTEQTGIVVTKEEMTFILYFLKKNSDRITEIFSPYNPYPKAEQPLIQPASTNTQPAEGESQLAATIAATNEILAGLQKIETENVNIWRTIQKIRETFNQTVEKVARINSLYLWHTGDELPKIKESSDSLYSVDVLAIIDLKLAPDDMYHAIMQYDYNEQTWYNDESIPCDPPKYWQYIWDNLPEKKNK